MMQLELTARPERYVSRGGMPSFALPHHGMPSYESEHGRLLVFDMLHVHYRGEGVLLYMSRSWVDACARSVGEPLVALHDGADAVFSWRPVLYMLRGVGELERLGSQTELEWRHGMTMMAQDSVRGDGRDSRQEANVKARALLLESLDSQQRIELVAWHRIPVRGAATRNLYHVRPGNGFEMVDKATREPMVSYCFHPDKWLPDDDVALATVLALEDPKMEVEFLEHARSTIVSLGRRGSEEERAARDLEAELIGRVRAREVVTVAEHVAEHA